MSDLDDLIFAVKDVVGADWNVSGIKGTVWLSAYTDAEMTFDLLLKLSQICETEDISSSYRTESGCETCGDSSSMTWTIKLHNKGT